MQDVIEKQKQSMIAQIEKHAAEMNRHLDELMLSHKALAQNMTKGLHMSYLKLEELAQEGRVIYLNISLIFIEFSM